MTVFCIIETEAGRTVAGCPDNQTAEQTAEEQGGFVVDPGPYKNYDEAYDALLALEQEINSDDEESDIVTDHTMESRPEPPH